jgi:hypothetical protein
MGRDSQGLRKSIGNRETFVIAAESNSLLPRRFTGIRAVRANPN